MPGGHRARERVCRRDERSGRTERQTRRVRASYYRAMSLARPVQFTTRKSHPTSARSHHTQSFGSYPSPRAVVTAIDRLSRSTATRSWFALVACVLPRTGGPDVSGGAAQIFDVAGFPVGPVTLRFWVPGRFARARYILVQKSCYGSRFRRVPGVRTAVAIERSSGADHQ